MLRCNLGVSAVVSLIVEQLPILKECIQHLRSSCLWRLYLQAVMVFSVSFLVNVSITVCHNVTKNALSPRYLVGHSLITICVIREASFSVMIAGVALLNFYHGPFSFHFRRELLCIYVCPLSSFKW
jgi:hypothetical protein